MQRWVGDHGYTHSRNARAADERGEMPLTRAIEAVYTALECKLHKVCEFLEQNCGRGSGPNGVRMVGYYTTVLTDKQKRELLMARE